MSSEVVEATAGEPLPSGWCEGALVDVAHINPSGTVALPADDDLISFVPMAAVEALSGRLDASRVRPWREVKKGYTKFQDGDVLFAKITPCMENGKAAVARGLSHGTGAGSTEFHVLRPTDALSAELLLHYVLREEFRKSARAHMTGTAGQLRVPSRFLNEQKVPLPPLPEQHRIVSAIESYFTRLDDAVATLERVQRNLKRYRASVLKSAVEGRLVPTEADLARTEGRSYEPASVLLTRILAERRRRWEEAELAKMKAKGKPPKDDKWKAKYKEPVAPDTSELPELPEGWCWASLDQVLAEPLANGRSVKTADIGFPVLRLTALQNGTIDLNERKIGAWTAEDAEGFLVQAGDFLVSRGNGSIRLVGVGGLVRAVSNPVAFPDTMIRVRLCQGVEPRLFALVWNSRAVRNQVEMKAKTTAGIFKVNQGDLASCIIPLPPAAEQHRIHGEIERLFSVAAAGVELSARSATRLARLRQSILKWAFEGRLVHQDPTDEPASVLLERIRAEREAATRGATDKRGRARQKRVQ